jgi:chromosomal replication initiation ATPase DnaA
MTFTPSIAFGPIQRSSTHRLVRVTDLPPVRCESVLSIQRVVAEAFGVPAATMWSKTRAWHVTKPRMIAMSIAHDLTGLSTAVIGKEFGGRDHSTVLHACKQVHNWASTEKGLGALVDSLRQRCMGRAG